MARINLLPWREARRKELAQQFFIAVTTFVVMTLVIVGIVHVFNKMRIEYQQSRIQLLQTHVANLEQKIEKIKLLEKEKQKLKARIAAIEQLQGNRSLIVHLFDELVTHLPDGVSLVSMTQSSHSVTISGVAESNARVSSFMRNLDASEWLSGASLEVIEAKNENVVAGEPDKRVNSFTIRFKQVVAGNDEEDDA